MKIGTRVICNNKMDKGKYSYVLTAPYGKVIIPGYFEPYFTPAEMLKLGVFEGKYMNDCRSEFPSYWYKEAKLSQVPDIKCNYFKLKSRQSLQIWIKNKWIYGDDNRGWFQWYCRYYMGRRDPVIDEIQIKRWRAFARHSAQVKKHCPGDLDCRKKQRQALLQWAHNCFI